MLLLPFACAGAPDAPDDVLGVPVGISDVSVEIDPVIPTLVHVSWTSDAPVRARATWTGDGEEGQSTVHEASTEHAFDLLGLPAGETATLDLLHVGDDGTEVSVATEEIALAEAPDWVPNIRVDIVPLDPPTPFLFVVTYDVVRLSSALQVIDWHGHPVWWRPAEEVTNPFAEPTRDGGGLYYPGHAERGMSDAVVRIDWDGTRTVFGGEDVHHEVYERDDGAVAACRNDVREFGDERVAIDVLTVISPDGSTRDVWDAAAHYDPTAENRCATLRLMDGTRDATHCNGLAYDEDAGEWLVSLYCTGTVVAVDDATGEERWAIGGDDGTLSLPDDADFALAHSPRFRDGNVVLFDNGSSSKGSRAIELDVDRETGTVAMVREWGAPMGEYTPLVGTVTPYGDGVLLGFGTARTAYWLGPEEELRAQLSVDGTHVVSAVGGVALPKP